MLIVITVKKVEADSVVSSSLMLGLLATLFNVHKVFFLFSITVTGKPAQKKGKENN